ncbi:S8 family serine peptidase [Runella sp.]|uniref:S8 family serine peptidase n=1 Tax=Runella sp. TaxID=1960881 RepID=UPI003D1005C8
MNLRLLLLLFSIFISCASLAQTIHKDFIDGEIYLKVRKKPTGVLSKAVNFSTDLPFLTAFANDFIVAKTNRAFFTAGSENLQKVYRLTLKKPEKIDALLNALKQNSEVAYVEKVPFRKIIATPNDPNVGSQWSLNKIKAFEAWDVNAGSATIVVGIVDNAFQTNHTDLQANMLPGRDLGDNDNNPNPHTTDFSHGTHVAGIVSAVTDNSIGIAAAANNRIKILPVKATPDAGNPLGIYYGFEGIMWAADNGAQIISLSWGGIGYSQAEQEVIDYAYSKGIVIVAAAGNDNNNIESFPAAYRNVIAVASLDTDDKRSSFSTYGTWVDISAPGRGILSTVPFNDYATFSGTSMATPLVASALGYIWSCLPSLTPAQLEGILKNTADNIDSANPTQTGLLGVGRINLLKAVSCPSGNLLAATITAGGSTYICQGESVTLSANSDDGLSYKWLKNGQDINVATSSLVANTEGNYQVMISKGSCTLTSAITKVAFNTLTTPSPSVLNKEVPYCTPLTIGNGMKATAANCNYAGPTTFTYDGPTVGYDGLDKSGADPTVNVQGLGGLITSIKVSITWEKKDQGDENSCDLADGGARPFNEEVSFRLKSPSGTIITLIAEDTYGSGATSSGIVTTVFEENAAPIPQNALPASGTFAPNQSFSAFINEVPFGGWTLLPEDNSFLDPLCVKNFSITITTNSLNQAPTITWWDAVSGGNLLSTGGEYLAPTNAVGDHTYYIQARCDGLCPSQRTPAILTVTPIPQVFAFPISYSLSNDSKFKSLLKKQTIAVTKNAENQYEVFDSNEPSTSVVIIGNTPPLTGPITLCTTGTYLLLAVGCTGNSIVWSSGKNDQALVVTPTSPINYSAICLRDWGACEPITSNTLAFQSPLSQIVITDKIYANSVQTFNGTTINASNKIETPAKIDYRANNTILLNPGFNVNGNSVFTAQTGIGCNN